MGGWLVAMALLGAPGARAEEILGATPYRPTVANPAELSEPGWLEVEAGWIRNRGDEVTRYAFPYTAKLAFSENWGVLMEGDIQARELSSGGGAETGGDTSLMLKHRIPTSDEKQNFGIEVGAKLPMISHGLGDGVPNWVVNGIYSVDFAENWRLDANLGIGRLGNADPGKSRMAKMWAVSVSRAIGSWTLAGEVSGENQGGVPDGAQVVLAASYAVTPRVVVDIGVSQGLADWSDQSGVFSGVTWLVGDIF